MICTHMNTHTHTRTHTHAHTQVVFDPYLPKNINANTQAHFLAVCKDKDNEVVDTHELPFHNCVCVFVCVCVCAWAVIC